MPSPVAILSPTTPAAFLDTARRGGWKVLFMTIRETLPGGLLAGAESTSNPAGQPIDVTEARDVMAARTGDGEAYARLIRRHQAEIATQMRRFSRDPQVCAELVHDVFVEAYLALHGFRGSAPWLHWLRKIAVRVGYRYWTRRGARREVVQLSRADWESLRGTSPMPGTAAETADLLATLLNRLPPADRLILTLLYLDGCTLAEAATRAGWTVIGAKLRAFRARNKLKSLIEGGDA